ncbi:class I adenylate-forming enzyme family protein [Nocardioides houyundeii]|uniref:class I adenylate-forming enzyme family protein n=1 Tax=Nocardioides houyundeii TaxID=2045452 RepID=UPI000DF418EE|nr:AMP-binding protein [Nocardioides houyundeii]
MAITDVAHAVQTVGEVLDRVVEEHGDRTALVSGDERISYAELASRVDELSRVLIAFGIDRGDRVAIRLANSPEWVTVMYATARIGAVLVPINTSASDSEVVDLLTRSGARLLFSGGDGRARAFTEKVGLEPVASLTAVVAVGEEPIDGVLGYAAFVRGGRVDTARLAERRAMSRPDDTLFLIYTSGTTGRPKGVMHSHAVLRNMQDAQERLEFSASDSVVLYLPLCHVYALFVGTLALLGCGATLVLMPRFSPADSLDLMEAERASLVFGVRTMYYDQIADLARKPRDLSSIRLCLASGPPDHVRKVREHMGPAINLYGMTECSAITALPRPSDPADLSADTAGEPLPSFEIRVRREDGTVAALGRGECEVRGPAVTDGYFQDSESTAAAFSEDGWFKTGDEVEISGDGRLRYLSRIKDSYKIGGENVDPAEVEAVISSHPTVGLAAAVGLPDARLGEIAVVFVQPAPGQVVDTEAVLDLARERLARYKVPHEVRVVAEMPRTTTGKIQKHHLRRLARDEQPSGSPTSKEDI